MPHYVGNVGAANPDLSCQNKKLLSTITVIDGQQRSLQIGISAMKTLWKATNATATPYRLFLVPPTVSCFQCQPSLSANNPPTTVVLYLQDGPLSALVIILQYARCNLNYHPKVFRNKVEGYRYSDADHPVVKCIH